METHLLLNRYRKIYYRIESAVAFIVAFRNCFNSLKIYYRIERKGEEKYLKNILCMEDLL